MPVWKIASHVCDACHVCYAYFYMYACMHVYIYMIYTFAVKFRLMRVQINEVNIYIYVCLSVCVFVRTY